MIRKLLIGVIIAILLIGGGVYISNFLNSVPVKITVPHTSSITAKQGDHTIAETKTSQTLSFRAPKFSHIIISFTGTGIYESSSRAITVEDKSVTKTLQPYYSANELKKLATENSQQITDTILTYNPNIKNLYSIRDITLYHYGEWASAQLSWIGSYGDNSDSLHVVLSKKGDKWSIIYQPNILLFKDYYSEVPLDILERVNNPSS